MVKSVNPSFFGEYVKIRREYLKIGSRELCRRAGVAETYISQLEKGKIKKPDYNVAYSICRSLFIQPPEINPLLAMYSILPEEKPQKSIKNVSKLSWLDEDIEQLKNFNNIIHANLETFIEKDLSKAKTLINGLHKMLNSSKADFEFFCQLIEILSDSQSEAESKNILNLINNSLTKKSQANSQDNLH